MTEPLTAAAGWCAPSGGMPGMKRFWSGPLTRLDVRTNDRREILSSGFTTRSFPMPVLFQKAKYRSHEGAVVVARILGARIMGDHVFGWGDWLDPETIPEVAQAYALAESGVNGMSVDPGGSTMEVDDSGPETVVRMTNYQMAGATLVPVAAFDSLRITMSDEPPDLDSRPGDAPTSRCLVAAGSPEVHDSGAMIALVPTTEDASRLAVPGGEPASELHTTLYFLGEADNFTPESRGELIARVRQHVSDLEPVEADGFAISVFNPGNEDRKTCIVLGVGGDGISRARAGCIRAIEDADLGAPEQHSPYVPHVTLIYTNDAGMVEGLVDRTGPITYDRVRVVFGDNATDIPLPGSSQGAAEMPDIDHDNAPASGDFAVTSASGWEGLPIADRKQPFDADDAIARILAWAHDDVSKAGKMFLWHNPKAAAGTRDAYRLPVGDIINGRPTLVYHAIYAAAALINGAHGGLPGLSDSDKSQLRSTITRMYAAMSRAFRDPNMKAPWDNPALNKGNMEVETEETAQDDSDGGMSLVAAAGPVAPPVAWFARPALTGPSPLRVEGDGRVFGHLAIWDTCHIAPEWNMQGVCTTPPRSGTEYAAFHTGEVLTAEGDYLPVGRITLGGTHAKGELSYIPTLAHYENSGAAVAVIRAGEDEFGIWVAGALIPGLSEEKVAELRRSPLSGDWRRYNGNLELTAALAVNTGAFPVTRIESGRQLSLVAAGMVTVEPELDSALISPDIPELATQVADELESRAKRTERLATLLTVDQYERGQKLARIKGE